MNNEQRHSIFTLLYAIVLIDNRVMKVEVDQFLVQIEDFLTRTNFIETLKAKSIISTWFVQNYKSILTQMRSPDREFFLMMHVDNLKSFPHRQDVYDMMKEIAIADDEYHQNEQDFIDKVADIWNLIEE